MRRSNTWLDTAACFAIPAVRNSSYQCLNEKHVRSIIKEHIKRTMAMKRIVTFLNRLFGTPVCAEDDHLMGAVDLSDSAYCFELLTRHGLR